MLSTIEMKQRPRLTLPERTRVNDTVSELQTLRFPFAHFHDTHSLSFFTSTVSSHRPYRCLYFGRSSLEYPTKETTGTFDGMAACNYAGIMIDESSGLVHHVLFLFFLLLSRDRDARSVSDAVFCVVVVVVVFFLLP